MKHDQTILRIAGHTFVVQGAAIGSILHSLGGFAPFARKGQPADNLLFTYSAVEELPAGGAWIPLHQFLTEGIDCIFFSTGSGYAFSMDRHDGSKPFTWIFEPHRRSFSVWGDADAAQFRFSLWQAMNLAAVPLLTAAVHCSTVCYQGKAVLFLGESGTGKSTHTRLWLENIEGCSLLNDDSPFLRIENGAPIAYGSPWSGKTPCYRNESFPVAAIVRLGQGPENNICKLDALSAIGALQPSLPPSLAYDPAMSETLMDIVSAAVAAVPVYRLDCLPEPSAARLSCRTIFGR